MNHTRPTVSITIKIPMSLEKKNDMRCPVCQAEWNLEETMKAGNKSCPNCHTMLQPLKMIHDGYIKANWQDLRVLAIYARRWAAMFDDTPGNQHAILALEVIIDNLKKHRPKDSLPLLPDNEVIFIGKVEGPKALPKPSEIEYDNTRAFTLKPDGEGKIVSPFYRKGIPPIN